MRAGGGAQLRILQRLRSEAGPMSMRGSEWPEGRGAVLRLLALMAVSSGTQKKTCYLYV
jgi:hypothetical protein